MAIGDIGSILDKHEYDADKGICATALKLSDGVVAIWYCGTDNDGFVKTYPVDAAGDVGTMIDSWEFDTTLFVGSDYHPSVVAVSGDVFAIAYRGSAISTNDLHVKTMTIATDGTITKTAIETAAFATQPIASAFGGFIKKPGTTKYIAFWDEGGLSPNGFMAVVNIDDDGTNIALADSWEFDTNVGADPIIIHVSGHIFAAVYNRPAVRAVRTFQVADNGTITKTFIAFESFGDDTALHHYILLVSGSVYAVFSSGTDEVYTFTIDAAGTVTAVDTGVFYTEDGYNVSPLKFKEVGGNSYFVYSIRTMTPDYYGYIVTLPISIAGAIGSVIDSQLIEDGGYQYGFVPVEVRSGVFVFPWVDTPGSDGFISTADILVADAVFPSSNMARISSIRHICRPGFCRMQVGLGDIGFDIDVAEATVRKALDTAKEEEVIQPEPPPTKPPAKPPEAAPTPPAPEPPSPSYWGGGPPSQIPGIEEYLERQRQKEPEYEQTPGLPSMMRREVEKPSLWSRMTPWREEAGETFGGEVMERFESARKWLGGLFK